MSRSRARKNRFKYKTLRRLGFFKIFVMNYPEHNGWVYPTMQPQETSLMESHLDTMCAVLGVSRENLVINAPVSFASSVEEKVKAAIKTEHEIKRERFRGPDLSTLHGDDSLNRVISPWPTKMNLAGVWSNPVDVSNLQGPSFEIVKIEAMVQKAKHQLRENTLQRVMETAKILGLEIEVDPFLLRDDLKVFKQGKDVFKLSPVEYDSNEWVFVMIAVCQHPELIDRLKGNGYDFIHIQHGNDEEATIDTYQLFDTANDKDTEAFKPVRWNTSIDFTEVDQAGEPVKRFAARKLRDQLISWDLIDDK